MSISLLNEFFSNGHFLGKALQLNRAYLSRGGAYAPAVYILRRGEIVQQPPKRAVSLDHSKRTQRADEVQASASTWRASSSASEVLPDVAKGSEWSPIFMEQEDPAH